MDYERPHAHAGSVMGENNPVILAQLPRPSSGTAGDTRFGPCYGLKKSRKRKRFEVAAAIDGEALNIYDVQASKLVSSYAVPPISSFTCSPCSVYTPPSRDSASVRYTLCAVQRPEYQLQCFVETVNRSELPIISAYKYDLAEESPVIFVDFVPTVSLRGEPDSPPDIIAVHRNGTIRRVSHNLQDIRWICTSHVAADETSRSTQVVSAHWLSYADASTAVFRKRSDILKEYAPSGSSFVVLLHRNGLHHASGLRIRVLQVPSRPPDGCTSKNSERRLRSVVSHPIPAFSSDATFRFHIQASSAKLSVMCKNELTTYDLSAYAPRICSKVVLNEAHSSLFPLGSHLAAGALRSDVRIYDVKHQSIRASYRLNTKSNRMIPGASASKPIRFISYFSKIDTLVAVRGRNLVKLKLPRTATKGRNRAWPGSLLIDSLGCSTFTSEKVTNQPGVKIGRGFSKELVVPNEVEKSRWEAQQKSLNSLVRDQHVEEFESIIASELPDAPAEVTPRDITSRLSFAVVARFAGYDKIYYILSKMFRVSAGSSGTAEANESDLDIAFLPPQTYKWLARNNHLTTFDIEQSLSTQPPRLSLKAGAVALSIMKQDPSLGLLDEYLRGGNIVNLDEIAQVIKALLRAALSTDRIDSPSQQLLLENSHPTQLDGPVGHGKEAAGDDWQPTTTSGGWSRNSCKAMEQSLEKLHNFSALSISSAVHTQLDTDETLALIQFLRQRLFYNGYTSSLPSFATKSEDQILSLEVVARVLSSCVDSLGPLGFLESTVDGGLWDGLVPDLKAEISLALAGIDEATYLKGILQEMVRYGNSTSGKKGSSWGCSEKRSTESGMDGGTVERMYGELLHDQDYGTGDLPPTLPLSMKEEKAVNRIKRRKGGGELIRRSGRELRYLQDRNIGQYSFERLVL